MLIVGSALRGYAIEARDGRIGTVKTFLFDDMTWKIRWLVVDTGHWLMERQVLVHPSAVGLPDHAQRHLPVDLTKAQIEASPDVRRDEPVSMQMESHLYSYYGWDPYWGPDYYGAGLIGPALMGPGMTGGFGLGALSHTATDVETMQLGSEDGDPHLRSMHAVRGYQIHATDGAIGHVENFLVDDATWAIRYLIVDTRNWWPGAHVLIAPYAVSSIDWRDNQVRLNVTRDQVKSSPPWDPLAVMEQVHERQLHAHYGWPGYGW